MRQALRQTSATRALRRAEEASAACEAFKQSLHGLRGGERLRRWRGGRRRRRHACEEDAAEAALPKAALVLQVLARCTAAFACGALRASLLLSSRAADGAVCTVLSARAPRCVSHPHRFARRLVLATEAAPPPLDEDRVTPLAGGGARQTHLSRRDLRQVRTRLRRGRRRRARWRRRCRRRRSRRPRRRRRRGRRQRRRRRGRQRLGGDLLRHRQLCAQHAAHLHVESLETGAVLVDPRGALSAVEAGVVHELKAPNGLSERAAVFGVRAPDPVCRRDVGGDEGVQQRARVGEPPVVGPQLALDAPLVAVHRHVVP
mmetsp:Transcript_42745/g.141534  ORF Transcript_42745/g.141534 Transcript_42745/m.141534 type:complete len:316 (-) Transcript_42745:917-1864(-)